MWSRLQLSKWFDERLGTRAIRVALFDRNIPKSSPLVEWIYTLGSVLLFFFILQAVTGMMLAMNYVASPDHAFDAARYISTSAPMGQFIRGLHSWGATAMVVVIGAHMLTTFLSGSYKYPRESTWITGVVLFLIVMLFGFTGYLLPWNQKSYWATVVGTNIAGATPYIGQYIVRFFRGGSEVGPQTLTRFYALHVLMLPAALIVFVSVHLFMVVRQGISAPPKRHPEYGRHGINAQLGIDPGLGVGAQLSVDDQRSRAADEYHREKEAGESFYPFYLSKDAVAVLLALSVLVILVLKYPAEIGEIADPASTSYNPRPDWYFLFLFQALKYFPGSMESVAAVMLPGLALLVLVSVPFFDRRMRQHPLDRPIATGFAISALVGVIALTVIGAQSPLLNPYVPELPTVAEGHRLFHELNCAYCHAVNGRGSRIGPDLMLDPLKHDKAWIVVHLERPGEVFRPGARTAMTGLLPEESSDLFDYINELQGGGPYSDKASRLFYRNCGKCHMVAGHGGAKAPDLSGIGLVRSVSFIHRYIEDPKALYSQTKMPPFLQPEGKLTHVEIEDIARFLAHQRTPAPPKN
ncbi:cytochrome b N-terminal domain-containing protein [Candidatus Binatus sp.]|jgi:ubiquinol-cytochrome c reductase cytochrome b subunit|uniref:cytochrome b N-terminal domain-containing protein n=1 Tax=Candidatus Binatus sp. TaxID=2811406 RepID=UPI003BCDFB07